MKKHTIGESVHRAAGLAALTLALGLVFFTLEGCPSDDGEPNTSIDDRVPGGNGTDGGAENYIWLWKDQKNYTITDGVAGEVSYQLSANWINYVYTDEAHYEQEYTSILSQNAIQSNETYTYTTIASIETTTHTTRDGQVAQSTTTQISDYTTTTDYVNPDTVDTVTHIQTENVSTSTTYYDSESGLMYRQTSSGTSTTIQNGGEPVVTPINTDIFYTIELLNESAGIKTYKHFDAGTGGTSDYRVYKIKDGVTLEDSLYTSGDVLNTTTTYNFSDNSVIREKLPTFTLSNVEYVSTPASNSYQTCEIVSNSDTELVLRVKTYSSANVLTGQYDTTYEKYTL